jgi:hypothetical protein
MRKNRALIPAALIVLTLAACVFLGRSFLGTLVSLPPAITSCTDPFEPSKVHTAGSAAFQECLKKRAQIFLSTDYAESKDLAKAFLTLLTAVFVASITFSEKIVNMQNAGWWSKGLMITAWSCLLLAIVSCGSGLGLMAEAAYVAANLPSLSVVDMENSAAILFVWSGLMFGGALAALLVAGVISLVQAPAMPSSPLVSAGPDETAIDDGTV